MKTILLLVGVTFAGSVFAQDPPAAQKKGYQVSTKSFFNVQTPARNPFEPIGYTPKRAEVQRVAVGTCTPDMFRLSSIIVGSPGVAVINGRDYTEGDWIPVPGQEVKVRLLKVSDGQVILLHPSPEIGNQGRIVVRYQ